MKLDHLQLVVRDVAGLHAFFAPLPGLETSAVQDGYFEVHSEGSALSVFDADGFAAATGLPLTGRPDGTVLQFSVADVDEALARAKQSPGVTAVMGPIQTAWGTRSAYVTHDSGLTIEFYRWN